MHYLLEPFHAINQILIDRIACKQFGVANHEELQACPGDCHIEFPVNGLPFYFRGRGKNVHLVGAAHCCGEDNVVALASLETLDGVNSDFVSVRNAQCAESISYHADLVSERHDDADVLQEAWRFPVVVCKAFYDFGNNGSFFIIGFCVARHDGRLYVDERHSFCVYQLGKTVVRRARGKRTLLMGQGDSL